MIPGMTQTMMTLMAMKIVMTAVCRGTEGIH